MRSTDVVTPAQYLVQASNDLLRAARDNDPDVTSMLVTKDKANALVNNQKLRNAAAKRATETEIKFKEKLNRIDNRISSEIAKIEAPIQRMAGITALLGTAATAGVMNQQNIINKEEAAQEREERDKFMKSIESLKTSQSQSLSTLNEQITKLQASLKERSVKTSQTESVKPGDAQSNNLQSSTSTPLSSASSSLTGSAKFLADAIAKFESGDYGYEAFNQGGEKGGTAIPVGFKSGNYKEQFGTSLTDKTLREIIELQRDPGRSVMSDKDWVNSGKLHAVGRYQFIAKTLKDEVNRMGLDLNTKFTPEVQDKIFLSHVKRIGSIKPWVGPMNKYSAAEINNLNNLITTL